MTQSPSELFWVFSQWVSLPWVCRTSRNMAPGAYTGNPIDRDWLQVEKNPLASLPKSSDFSLCIPQCHWGAVTEVKKCLQPTESSTKSPYYSYMMMKSVSPALPMSVWEKFMFSVSLGVYHFLKPLSGNSEFQKPLRTEMKIIENGNKKSLSKVEEMGLICIWRVTSWMHSNLLCDA